MTKKQQNALSWAIATTAGAILQTTCAFCQGGLWWLNSALSVSTAILWWVNFHLCFLRKE